MGPEVVKRRREGQPSVLMWAFLLKAFLSFMADSMNLVFVFLDRAGKTKGSGWRLDTFLVRLGHFPLNIDSGHAYRRNRLTTYHEAPLRPGFPSGDLTISFV